MEGWDLSYNLLSYSEVIRVVCCDHDLIQRYYSAVMFADEDLRVEAINNLCCCCSIIPLDYII